MAGRGFGKTRLAAEDMAWYALTHPGHRLAVVAPTYADARDTCVEGESGLLACLPREEVRLWNRSLGEILLANGARFKLFSADEPDRMRGPQFHRAWCVAEGTPVATAMGEVSVEDVRIGDLVLTSAGYRRVGATGSRGADLYRLTLADGRVLEGSGEHPIATDRGWVALRSIRSTDRIWTWHDDGGRTRGAISSPTKEDKRFTTIEWSGNGTMGRSPLAGTSTTSTGTVWTTALPTYNSSPAASIESSTVASAPTPAGSVAGASSPRGLAVRCIARDAEAVCLSAAADSSRVSAACAGPSSRPAMATIAVSGASIWVGAGRVVNLQVEGTPEFFANGILTHNCDELAAFRYPETFDTLMMGLRLGEHPQVVATTTPRPTRGLRDLMARPDVRVTRGSTFDNAANLAPAALEALRRRYGGTRLGRQELEGELLEDVEGALWRRDWIEATRTATPPLFWQSKVMGLDPSDGTEGGAEQGIAIAGIGSDWDMYVTHSDGLRVSGLEYCKHAVRLAVEEECSRIVVEKNHGGTFLVELLEQAMRLLGLHVGVQVVTASRDKRARAEPVAALYEQGKVRHLGSFLELEDQQTSFTGLEPGPSPDRMDAAVWALTELKGRNWHGPASEEQAAVPYTDQAVAGGAVGWA